MQADVIDGLVSMARARDVYGVVLNTESYEVKMEETKKLRSEFKAKQG